MTEGVANIEVQHTSKTDLTRLVDDTLRDAVYTDLSPTELNQGIYAIEGMSGRKYRQFINTLIGAMPVARYMEIGSCAGSTMCAAIAGNTLDRAMAIDNWSQFGGPRAEFMANVIRFGKPGSIVRMFEEDFRKVDFRIFGQVFNVYLYDGPHDEQDHYDGIALPLPALAPEFVLIVDDWNWDRVRAGTLRAIADKGLEMLC
jgi:hypothetical protein